MKQGNEEKIDELKEIRKFNFDNTKTSGNRLDIVLLTVSLAILLFIFRGDQEYTTIILWSISFLIITIVLNLLSLVIAWIDSENGMNSITKIISDIQQGLNVEEKLSNYNSQTYLRKIVRLFVITETTLLIIGILLLVVELVAK